MIGGGTIAAFGPPEEDRVSAGRHPPPGGVLLLRLEPRGARRGKEVLDRFGTAALQEAALRSRARFERLPGRLIPNDDHMGLDNYPVRCKCGKHAYRRGVPRGYTHRSNEACPLDGDDFVRGFFGSCCWLRGKVASYELRALGNAELADRMYDDMTAEAALAFAGELRQFADEQEKLFSGEGPKPRGCEWTELKSDASGKATTVVERSSFEEALAAIRKAADWYEKTSRLGYGVEAWT